MEEFEKAREDLLLAASRARVLADLMLPSTDLQDVDRAALAHRLRDLASGLERNLASLGAHLHRLVKDREERT